MFSGDTVAAEIPHCRNLLIRHLAM